MNAPQLTHNAFCDSVRAAVAARAHPSPLSDHDIECVRQMAKNSFVWMREAMRLADADNVLRIQAETVMKAATALGKSAAARLPYVRGGA